MIHAFAAQAAKQPLSSYTYPPQQLGPYDIEVDIVCCGLCYSDVHLINNDWSTSQYPLVPGHEIIGHVTRRGSEVQAIHINDRVGIGWQCGACYECESCLLGYDTCCNLKIRTCVNRHGGFADRIIIDSRFAYLIPSNLDSYKAAPLLCAGITVYTPFRLHSIKASHKVGIIGIGGLGHLALQFAKSFGCEVTAISSSSSKREAAIRLGATHFITLDSLVALPLSYFDFILSTVHADLEWPLFLQLLKPHGKLCFVGIPPSHLQIPTRLLISGNRAIYGSGTGNRYMMKEMLDLCSQHGIQAEVQVLPMRDINTAIETLKKKEVKFRIVLSNK